MQEHIGRSFPEISFGRPEGGRRLRPPRHIERERRLLAMRYLSRRRIRFERMGMVKSNPDAVERP